METREMKSIKNIFFICDCPGLREIVFKCPHRLKLKGNVYKNSAHSTHDILYN